MIPTQSILGVWSLMLDMSTGEHYNFSVGRATRFNQDLLLRRQGFLISVGIAMRNLCSESQLHEVNTEATTSLRGK